MIDIKRLFNKIERGLRKEKVPVKRKSGTKYEYRRVGKKSPRKGTGKMDKFPQSIKKEILDQRSFGESGAKIKETIENMIDHGLHVDQKTNEKLNNIKIKYNKVHSEWLKETDPIKIKKLDQKMKIIQDDQRKIIHEGKSEVSTYINGKSIGRDLVKEGLITNDGKLTVTFQALTNWAKSQGIELTKKRITAVDKEKEAHVNTKKELDRVDKKVARLEVAAKHNLDEIKLIQQSKQESDKIRGDLGKDNKDLRSKLKRCLAGEK